MNFETQSALFLAVFAVVISLVALDRGQRKEVLLPFLCVSLSLAVWAAGYAVYKFTGAAQFVSTIGVIFLPVGAVWMTRSLAGWRGTIGRAVVASTTILAVLCFLVLIVSEIFLGEKNLFQELQDQISWQLAGAAYLFLPLLGCLGAIFVLKINDPLTVDRRRMSLIFYSGFAATMIAILEYANLWGMGFVPITKLVLIIFLYVLYQTALLRRSFTIQEMVGKALVVLVSALFLATIYGAIVYWVGSNPVLFLFNTLAASFVILLVYEPIISRLESSAVDLLFRERGAYQEKLQTVSVKMTSQVRLNDLGCFLVEEAPAFLSAQRSLLWVRQGGKDDWRLFGKPFNEAVNRDVFHLLNESGVSEMMNAPISIEDLKLEKRMGKTKNSGILSLMNQCDISLLLPLRSQDALRGVWGLKSASENGFAPVQTELLTAFAPQVTLQLENAVIYERLLEQERLAALGEMAAGLAHEVKNPLGSLKGAAQVISRDGLSENDRNLLNIIVEESDRLNTTLTRFLAYARPFQPTLDLFDPGDLVRRTVDQFLLDGAHGDLNIDVKIENDLKEIHIDGEQIKQVLINLLQNAYQASTAGNSIQVNVFQAKDSTNQPDASTLCLEVGDDGDGMTPEQLSRIYEPFFTTKSGGSGLGLAISRRIVEAHGGEISVHSEIGKGTVVLITLSESQG